MICLCPILHGRSIHCNRYIRGLKSRWSLPISIQHRRLDIFTINNLSAQQITEDKRIRLTVSMFTLSVASLASLCCILANTANAAPIESHPALFKRAIGAQIGLAVSPQDCIGVTELKDGALIDRRDCTLFNSTSSPPFYNKWDISPGNNQVVRLSGLPAGSGDFCLDSDVSGQFPIAKIWTCYPGVPQQQ